MQGLSATADRNTPACVAGSCRETLLLLPENPDRNAAAAEAASQPEAAIVATDYDRTVTCALIRAAEKLRGRWIGKGRVHRCARARRSIPRARACPAHAVPATKRISGPKLQAAGAPRK